MGRCILQDVCLTFSAPPVPNTEPDVSFIQWLPSWVNAWIQICKALGMLLRMLGCRVRLPLPSQEPHLSTPALSSDSCLTSVCSWQWVCFRGLEICQVVFGLRVIHLSYFGLLCIHSFKEGSGSLLRGHYVTCMMLSLGDWRGTVSAFIINLEPLRLFYFPP